MRESMRDFIMDTVSDLHKSRIVDDITKGELESLCLPDLNHYSPTDISGLRKKLKLSQTALARFLNITPSTVQKWESGISTPSGAALKLLDLAARRGTAAIT